MTTVNTEPTEHRNPFDEFLGATMERIRRTATERRARLEAFLESKPKTMPCKAHPEIIRLLDFDLSAEKSARFAELCAGYTPCPRCDAERKAAAEAEWLRKAGVPEELVGATLDNWTPANEAERTQLLTVRQFARKRRGFLVLLGPVGTGKSHLAVSVARGFRSPRFVKQSTLLRDLRRTYQDRTAADPVAAGQDADLLVIDEMGLSGGGRDEVPMLHEILDYRHGERLPTILTGNVGPEQLKEIIGERLTDRLRESAFAILTFTGASRRPAAKARYFAEE